jgi:hypothetical protein
MINIFSFFISHSSATKDLARHLYYNSISNGLYPWYDESILDIGDHLDNTIAEGIEQSAGFVLLHSKQAMEKKWVPLEMNLARIKKNLYPEFKLIVVKLDEEPLDDFWTNFLFHSWNINDTAGSIIRVIESLTENNGMRMLGFSSSLNALPIFLNESNTIAEHNRNYLYYYFSHVKNLLKSIVYSSHDHELRDSINKVLQLYLVDSLPKLHGGLIQIEPGIYELIHGNRMRTSPRVMIETLDKYIIEITENNEIYTRLKISERVTNNLVTYPIPLVISLDAEL